jgi:hypothetical protein
MGVGNAAVRLTVKLHRDGRFKGFGSVIELGSQDLHFANRMDVYPLLQGNIDRQDAELKRIVEDAVRRSTERDFGTRWLYELMGFTRYACVDADGRHGAFVWDLNLPIPADQQGKYDFVTNHGTTEHVFNVYQSFKNIHDLTRPGGLMLHMLPLQGYLNHGFFNFQPCFYDDLAAENRYEIIEKQLIIHPVEDPEQQTMVAYTPESFAQNFTSTSSALLAVVLRKVVDSPFRIPFHGAYGAESCLLPYYRVSLTSKIMQRVAVYLLRDENSVARRAIRGLQKLFGAKR